MTRKLREISKTGIYHVYARGINHQRMFENDSDNGEFLEFLKKIKEKFEFELYAYCLMDNHFHLLIKEREPGEISIIMNRLLSTYVSWYNVKYQRSGGLIADRFKSKAVNADPYFWALIGYIHNNPVEKHMVQKPGYYIYSSYHEYVGHASLTDVDKARKLVPEGNFEKWHKPGRALQYKTAYENREKNIKLWNTVLTCSQGILPKHIEKLDRNSRNQIIVKLHAAGLTIREMERITGISRGLLYKIISLSENRL